MAKQVKFNNKRRYCRIISCKRLLSIYNLSAYCHAHQHLAPARELPKEELISVGRRPI